jgi:hypothetical protein
VHGRTVFPLCSGTTGMGQSCSAETLGRRVEAGIPSCLVVVCMCVLLCVLLYVWEGGQGGWGWRGGMVGVFVWCCLPALHPYRPFTCMPALACMPVYCLHVSYCLHPCHPTACLLLPNCVPFTPAPTKYCLPACLPLFVCL